MRASLAIIYALSFATPSLADYDIVQVTPVMMGGTQTTVRAPGVPVAIPGLAATLTLAAAGHSVTCHWSVSVQIDTVGGAVYVQLMRGGVPLGIPLAVYSGLGTMIVPVGDTASDTPGYIGPLSYSISIAPIVGQGHAPANFGGAGMIVCNEIDPQ